MRTRIAVIGSSALLAAFACSTVSAEWSRPRAPSSATASDVCLAFSAISGDISAGAGITNGEFGTPLAGEVFTVTVSGSGAGSFRIVGDPAGTTTLAGPTNAPGTLTYTADGSFPSGAVGVGYYFDSGQGTLTLQATCSGAAVAASHPAPALGGWALTLLGTLLALAGGLLVRRRGRALR